MGDKYGLMVYRVITNTYRDLHSLIETSFKTK